MKRLVLLVALVLAAGCYQPAPDRARDLAASMNEYGPGDDYPGQAPAPAGHPNRFRLAGPCDTPQGLLQPRPK